MGQSRTTLVGRFTQLFRARGGDSYASRYGRIEERHRSLSKAAEQWLTLLQEMEAAGQTTDPRYETYYQAYLQAKQQQKRADLELFNLRQSLTS
jgi:hypothetical protein